MILDYRDQRLTASRQLSSPPHNVCVVLVAVAHAAGCNHRVAVACYWGRTDPAGEMRGSAERLRKHGVRRRLQEVSRMDGRAVPINVQVLPASTIWTVRGMRINGDRRHVLSVVKGRVESFCGLPTTHLERDVQRCLRISYTGPSLNARGAASLFAVCTKPPRAGTTASLTAGTTPRMRTPRQTAHGV